MGGVVARDCSVHDGGGALLVVAPHGGMRASMAPHQRANDLHSDTLARAIAERLDASWVVNHGLDRNVIDLNRVSAVRDSAPWFAECLRDAVERILVRHAVAYVVFVHGWHVMQPRCDVGVGARLERPGDAGPRPELLTVSPGWLRERVEPFRAACAAIGIRATYGERWPGAHRNNLLQAFRRKPRRGHDGAIAELARCAASGRVEAMQLELGVPLRWPGRLRDAFVEACARSLGSPDGTLGTPVGMREASLGTVGEPAGTLAEPAGEQDPLRDIGRLSSLEGAARATGAARVTLQVHDPRAGPRGLGIIAGIAHLPDGDTGARLVLLPDGSRMAIFVGHARGHGPLAVEGLRVTSRDDGIDLEFEGHALLAEDGASYFRDERAQAAARLVPMSATLRYRAIDRSGYGRAEGRVALEGRPFEVDGFGFTTPFLAPARSRSRTHARALASFGPDAGLVAETGAESFCMTAAGHESLGCAALEDRGLADGGFVLDLAAAGRLECRPQNRIQVWRSLPDGRAARVTFGLARFHWTGGFHWTRGGVGSGFYECIESDDEPGH